MEELDGNSSLQDWIISFIEHSAATLRDGSFNLEVTNLCWWHEIALKLHGVPQSPLDKVINRFVA